LGKEEIVVMEVSDFEVERVMRWIPSRRRRNENNELADQFGREGTLRISGHINCDGKPCNLMRRVSRASLTNFQGMPVQVGSLERSELWLA
jgi:hypothetical protein